MSSSTTRSLFVAALLSSSVVSHVHAASQFSFFKQSSCNAGTAFYQISDPNPLSADLNCRQMPDDTVAIYIDEINEGCTIRTYSSSSCSQSTISGILLTAGTCFYTPDAKPIGSWRADCAGVDYQFTNGDDQGNSYSPNAGNADVVGILATATGPVTVTGLNNEITKTVVPVKATSSGASGSVTGTAAAQTQSADITSSSTRSTASAATPAMQSSTNAASRLHGGSELATSLTLGLGVVAAFGCAAFF